MSPETTVTDSSAARAARAVELEAIDKIADLKAEAEKVNVTLKPGTSKENARTLILDATFGPVGGVETSDGAEEPKDTNVASTGNVEADKEGTASQPAPAPEKKPEDATDPFAAQVAEQDQKLKELYDELVVLIKAAAVPGASADTAEQMRAGAVQFLRQCNAELSSARVLVETGKALAEQNNAQIQSMEKAKADIERRSEDYRRMTSGGEKNA